MNMRSVLSPFLLVTLVLTGLAVGGCRKAFLSKLPSTDLVVPSTLSDFQALLDNDAVMSGTPVLGELSADNFYLPYTFWETLDTREQNAYVWAKDIYQGQGLVDDWDIPYKQVFYANVVLEGLSGITVDNTNRQQWQNEEGSALFLRAYAFFNLAQLFAPVYDSLTAGTDPGIPLRLHSDITTPSIRASVKDTYTQILSDLQQASALLPAGVPAANRNRPSKPAALAMLARVYLSMRAYSLAGLYADSCLQLYSTLIDYNTVSPQAYLPFTRLNPEAIYQSSFLTYTHVLAALAFPSCIIDSNLYRSYAPNDLRSSIFYLINTNGQPNMKGGYSGTIYPFSGLAADEVYLVRAECAARQGDTTRALQDLNTLLKNRWLQGTFTPVTAASPAAVLDTILAERRKELAFRGLRWTDLRRLNMEGRNITLIRLLNGANFQLNPRSLNYVLPIPPDVLAYNPKMNQNPRQ
ncbi:MAG TPA: RagB/SusD family nutrient uptake outer membrane protein [Puia sp.]|nr:RagB/SusD family nutrient uptake outer membrane protein [Puia sp.]